MTNNDVAKHPASETARKEKEVKEQKAAVSQKTKAAGISRYEAWKEANGLK